MPDTTDVEIAKKLARKAWDKTYREAHVEEIKARKKAYAKAYYEANKDKESARSRIYRDANKKKVSTRSKAWYEANPEKHIEYSHLIVKEVTDTYVRALLCLRTSLKFGSIPQELIELKREQILLMRSLKELTHELNEHQERTKQPQ